MAAIFFDILGRLVFMTVESVVDGDDTDKAVFLIDDRDGEVAVFLELRRNELFVVRRFDGDEVLVHDVADQRRLICDEKRSYRNNADELAVFGDVAGVDRFPCQRPLSEFARNACSTRHRV